MVWEVFSSRRIDSASRLGLDDDENDDEKENGDGQSDDAHEFPAFSLVRLRFLELLQPGSGLLRGLVHVVVDPVDHGALVWTNKKTGIIFGIFGIFSDEEEEKSTIRIFENEIWRRITCSTTITDKSLKISFSSVMDFTTSVTWRSRLRAISMSSSCSCSWLVRPIPPCSKNNCIQHARRIQKYLSITNQSINQSITRTLNLRSINQSITHPLTQSSINQSINPSINQSITHSITLQSINQSNDYLMDQSINQWIKEWVCPFL